MTRTQPLPRAATAYHAGSKPSRYVILRRWLRWRWLADTIAEIQRATGSTTWQGNYQAASTDWLIANGYTHLLSTRLPKMKTAYWRERANKQGKDDIRVLIAEGYVVRVKAATPAAKSGREAAQAIWQLGTRWYLRPTALIDGLPIRDKIIPYETAATRYIEAMLWLERLWLWMADRAAKQPDGTLIWKGRALDLPACQSIDKLAENHRLAHHIDGPPAKQLSTGSTARRLWTMHEMGCITYLPTADKGNQSMGGKPSIVVLRQRPSEYVAGVRDRDIDIYAQMWQADEAYRQALSNGNGYGDDNHNGREAVL